MFYALIILPYVLILAGFAFLLGVAYRSHRPTWDFLLYPLLCSCLLTCGYAAWGHYAIATSRSSTAAIGYLFLPFYSLAVATVGFMIAWSILYLIRYVVDTRKGVPNHFSRIVLVVLAVLTLCLATLKGTQSVMRQRLLREAASVVTHPLDLEEILAQAVSSHDLDVLALLARNPNTSIKNLTLIYDSCKSHLSEFNPLEYVVFHALAQNRQTPRDILIALSKSQQSTVRLAVGTNPSTPSETLTELSTDKDHLVRYWLLSNPNIPKEILLQLASDPDELVQRHARQYLGSQSKVHP